VEVLTGERPTLRLPIVGEVRDFAGTLAYMNIAALQDWMREGPLISGAYLSVDPNDRARLYAELKRTPQVAGVAIKTTALESFRETFAENLLRMRAINVMFAVTIAIGVVYNAARISLSERSREMATLRVIGFTRGEISAILLGELAVVTLAAIPIGLVLGRSMCALVAAAVNEELFRIPIVVSRWTYGFAASVILAATLVSALLVRRRLDHLDLIAVLKSRE
jgi:putative ABC transport system permease protein